MPRALFLFNRTMNMPQPWLDAGYECWCVDIEHQYGKRIEGNLITIGADLHDWRPPEHKHFDFIAAFPPCTDLSVSGARWFKEKGLRRLSQAIALFASAVEICEESSAPYMIEKPVSVISSHYRKPDYTFQPWQYGDLWTKKTCLWTGGGFVMPPPIHETPPVGVTAKIHRMPPSPERANLRSQTPPGFAEAVFRANAEIDLTTPRRCG